MAAPIAGDPVKAQLVDKLPKRFKEIKFGIQYVPTLIYSQAQRVRGLYTCAA